MLLLGSFGSFYFLLLDTTGGIELLWELDSTTFVNEFATLALGFARLGSRVERPLICASHVLRIGYKVVASADKPQCAT